ncbi:hypothetical protein V8C34DRAFT_274962 [Trichoderma compactum]
MPEHRGQIRHDGLPACVSKHARHQRSKVGMSILERISRYGVFCICMGSLFLWTCGWLSSKFIQGPKTLCNCSGSMSFVFVDLWLARLIFYSGSKTLCERLIWSNCSSFMFPESGVEMTTRLYR